MIELNGEEYLNAKESALFLGVERVTFYHNTKDNVPSYELPGRLRRYYRKSDLKELLKIIAVPPQQQEKGDVSHATASYSA